MADQKRIVHVDMDAFFAAVEQRDNPDLRGKPVIIGSDPKEGKGRGVVSTCSYEARAFGIHSAMPISEAWKRCPQGVYISGNGHKYGEASEQIMKIMSDFTPDMEPVSVDEAFLDITGTAHLFGGAVETCRMIKSRIRSETGLTASLGMAPIKMAAKIASDYGKPDGLIIIDQACLVDFLKPLNAGLIPGVGPKCRKTLERLGIITIGEIADTDPEFLEKIFGKYGRHLWELAHGRDPRKVHVVEGCSSVSKEHTFSQDQRDDQVALATLLQLSEEVSRRLRDKRLWGRTISIKIRLASFVTCTRSKTIHSRTNFTETIYDVARELFQEFTGMNHSFRLLGVRVSELGNSAIPQSLFIDREDARLEKMHNALDSIRNRFGTGKIHRGRLIECPEKK
ncbi:MAG: DNA polymerase IV [Candidatus Wallbacteria bacterium HGW-Wallbacteria-1]|jgi:nucleotidyltransferase/DNA polymerase involved in DNA repair|uniref:DNA polymerase IV n=1 Tax=Candidatus Wallbacteria bacterium HGW-Wallbacteria-1 TaxID=2013854 RepID=A0A2N1PLD4_9BACT|nr:MAG: DNA polymerase IV [Candidatus Wallbacteria bacterium HGW-Wallbacteria-1]